MAVERDIIETVIEYLPEGERARARRLVTRLTQRVAKTVSASRLWTWRYEYQDITFDASNPVYIMKENCAVIADEGAALINASGDPAGKPLIYMSEHNYHIERTADDTSTEEMYYIPLDRLASGRRQVRFWPNIRKNARLWYWRKPTSSDIANIENEIMLTVGVLSLLPRKWVDDKQTHEKDFRSYLNVAHRYDKKAMAEKLRVIQSAITTANNRFMRSIQS